MKPIITYPLRKGESRTFLLNFLRNLLIVFITFFVIVYTLIIVYYGLRLLFLKQNTNIHLKWEILENCKAYKNERTSEPLLSLSILFTSIGVL